MAKKVKKTKKTAKKITKKVVKKATKKASAPKKATGKAASKKKIVSKKAAQKPASKKASTKGAKIAKKVTKKIAVVSKKTNTKLAPKKISAKASKPVVISKSAAAPAKKIVKAKVSKVSSVAKGHSLVGMLNKPAPAFSLLNTDGQRTNLADFSGKKVVLYFYPKDMTPGCTIEAEQFNTLFDEFSNYNTVILGVSQDDCSSHQKFREKHTLKFSLLSDTDHGEETGVSSLCQTYGVWVEKNNFGQKYMGIARTTFLIDEEGILVKIWEQVKAEGHAHEVLNYIKSLS